MLIGGDFNSRAKKLLATLSELSDQNPEQHVEVKELVNRMKIDKTEMKHLLQYLEEKELIRIVTIGGPYLYGDVQITEKGVIKATKLK